MAPCPLARYSRRGRCDLRVFYDWAKMLVCVFFCLASETGLRREDLPWLQQVRNREQNAKKDTYSSYHDVCDA